MCIFVHEGKIEQNMSTNKGGCHHWKKNIKKHGFFLAFFIFKQANMQTSKQARMQASKKQEGKLFVTSMKKLGPDNIFCCLQFYDLRIICAYKNAYGICVLPVMCVYVSV